MNKLLPMNILEKSFGKLNFISYYKISKIEEDFVTIDIFTKGNISELDPRYAVILDVSAAVGDAISKKVYFNLYKRPGRISSFFKNLLGRD